MKANVVVLHYLKSGTELRARVQGEDVTVVVVDDRGECRSLSRVEDEPISKQGVLEMMEGGLWTS